MIVPSKFIVYRSSLGPIFPGRTSNHSVKYNLVHMDLVCSVSINSMALDTFNKVILLKFTNMYKSTDTLSITYISYYN